MLPASRKFDPLWTIDEAPELLRSDIKSFLDDHCVAGQSKEECARLIKAIKRIVKNILLQKPVISSEAILSIGPSSLERSAWMRSIATSRGYAYLSDRNIFLALGDTYIGDWSRMDLDEAGKKWQPVVEAAKAFLLFYLSLRRYGIVLESPTFCNHINLKRLGYSVTLKHLTDFGNKAMDPSIGILGTALSSSLNSVHLCEIRPTASLPIVTLYFIEGSPGVEVVHNPDKYQEVQKLYDSLAGRDGWPRWEKILKGSPAR